MNERQESKLLNIHVSNQAPMMDDRGCCARCETHVLASRCMLHVSTEAKKMHEKKNGSGYMKHLK